ncbi:MAG TPA: aromatic ring-hydroxylating dioxygenase subunit alpha [Streptosporangiaceae bacterium]|nr:aromatic ring-hydroxylating dioxygenase subunit alpha [Streptosporangiaceae bacterium]
MSPAPSRQGASDGAAPRRDVARPGVFADQRSLRGCWHPVAFASDLAGGPVRADLLGEPLVLWRGAGQVRAMSDLCVHRGTALSLGWISGDDLVCPYHGWRYGPDGRCVAIPQLEDPSRVPAKARIPAFRAQERYGLIWVALDEPRWPLPEVPELEDSSWTLVSAGPYRWECDAARQVENFTDFGHFPWVHPGLLGDPSRPVVPRYEVLTEGNVLRYSIVRPEAPNSEDFPVFGNEQSGPPERRSRYELHLPYTIVLRLGWGGARGMVYFFASQPAGTDRSVGYVVIGRNYNSDQPDRVLRDFEDTIFGQDQVVVESQRPERVPFDLADELHLKFDAVAVAYRKAMRALGLATSSPAGAGQDR